MMRVLAYCALVALCAQAGGLASPADLANRAYSAERTASFTGVMVNTVFVSGHAEVSTVNVQRLRSKSRMEYLSGPLRGTTLIEDGQAICRLDKTTRSVCTTLPAQRSPDLKLLFSNYSVVAGGSESVAGREAQVLRLEPKHAGNPKAKLWVDAKTGVILRNERYLYNGKLAARSEYRSLTYSSVPKASAFALPTGWQRSSVAGDVQPLSPDKLSARVGFELLKPSFVPQGYVLDGYFLRSTGSGMPMAALKYTNGLNSISVFEHRCPGGGPGMGMGRGRGGPGGGMGYRGGRGSGGGMGMGMGRGRGRGQCVMRSDPQAEIAETTVNDIMVTVMGNLSPDLLRKMAESF